jgi:hypothetical protein
MKVLLDDTNRFLGFSLDPLLEGGYDIPLPPEPYEEYVRGENDWVHDPLPHALEAAKKKQVEIFSAACHAEITAGFISSALGSPYTYSSELEDQINLMGAASIAPEVGTLDYVCADANGVRQARPHTRAQLQQVYGDGAMHKAMLIYKFHTLRAQVEAAETAAQLASIEW